MTNKASLIQRLDDFECELFSVETYIDLLYYLPPAHERYARVLEDLHTHRLKVKDAYDRIRPDLLASCTT